MPTQHAVQEGECLNKIAWQYGFAPKTLWDLPQNADLKKKRADPNVLMPGEDVVFIPDKRPKEVSKPTDQRHKFQMPSVPSVLRFCLKDADGKPKQGVPWLLTIDGVAATGETGADGLISHPIPPNAKKGTLVVGREDNRRTFEVAVSHLEPVDSDDGVVSRLRNLGYLQIAGKPDDAQLRDAVRIFQQQYGLEVTGEVDDATRQALKDAHES